MSSHPPLFDGIVTVTRVVTRGHADWAVLNAVDANGEIITITGTMLGRYAEAGRQLHIQGRWKLHSAYGSQMHVHSVEPDLQPPTASPDI